MIFDKDDMAFWGSTDDRFDMEAWDEDIDDDNYFGVEETPETVEEDLVDYMSMGILDVDYEE